MSYIEMQYKSTALNKAVTIQVLLPSHEGFGEQMLPCKTVYFLHGINGNAKELVQYMNFRTQALLKGMAIILCDGDNSLYADRGDGINNYRQFIEEELVPVTRATFPLSTKREDTYIGGISMGGHGALVSGISRSDIFSKIAVMSPAINFYDALSKTALPMPAKFLDMVYGSKQNYEESICSVYGAFQRTLTENKEIPQLYITCGSQDPLVIEQTQRFVTWLKERTLPVEFVETDGMHDIFFWDKQLPDLFEFLAR